jgi:delta 1-pyrroline-5-carboxylate dehydrogenase
MAILTATAHASSNSDHALNRVFPVTTKLTKEELDRVTEFAKSQGRARGEWIRDVILKEMREGSAIDPSLAEILGVRLLLVNVLRPLAAGQRLTPEAFDKLLDEISEAKHALAGKLAASAGRK